MAHEVDTKSTRLIRINEVCKRVGFSHAGIYKLVSSGGFPKQIKIGPRAVCWVESEVDEWIHARIAASRAAAAGEG
ncbi:MAG TPA: AlpA family transcriptional regulator [Rhodanobacteraceae bacterium]